MQPDNMYRWLVDQADGSALGVDDVHLLASLVSVAWSEAVLHRQPWRQGVGLDEDEFTGLIVACFPQARPILADQAIVWPEALQPTLLAEDELAVRDLLWMNASNGSALQRALSVMIARRCSHPRHLWQDLGLRNRDELSALMQRHFRRLFERNYQNMKWKKFFFRMICRSEGFSLCVAPVCSECEDFDACFGAEDGEAVLAHIRAGRVAIA